MCKIDMIIMFREEWWWWWWFGYILLKFLCSLYPSFHMSWQSNHLIIEFYCSWLWQKYPVVHSHSNCLATPWELLLRVTIGLTWIINEFVTPQATSLMLIQKDSIHELKTQSMLEVVNTFSELKDIFQG